MSPTTRGWISRIRAFAKIHTQVPNAEFHVYGSGDRLESLKRLVAELGL